MISIQSCLTCHSYVTLKIVFELNAQTQHACWVCNLNMSRYMSSHHNAPSSELNSIGMGYEHCIFKKSLCTKNSLYIIQNPAGLKTPRLNFPDDSFIT